MLNSDKSSQVQGRKRFSFSVGPICICAELCGRCRGKPLEEAWEEMGEVGRNPRQEREEGSQNSRTISGAGDLIVKGIQYSPLCRC